MLKNEIKKILDEYESAKKENIAEHKLAFLIKAGFPNLLYGLIKNPNKYKIEGSPGYGSWARCPWIAILDPSITDKVQSGFFPMYLFREDLSGAYLSLNQGVTSVLLIHKRNTKKVLRSSAQLLLDSIGKKRNKFCLTEIDLKPSDSTNPSAYYEAANVCACFYDKEDLPSERILKEDFEKIIEIYISLTKKYKKELKKKLEKLLAPENGNA